MAMQVLKAQVRENKNNSRKLRREGGLPAICYGKGFDNYSISVDYKEFRRLYKEVGNTQVFNLEVEGKKLPVLVYEISYNPMTDGFDHIDFLQINMKEKVTATVPVEMVGEAPALKLYDCVLTNVKDEVEVSCLPGDIPHEIALDVSKLDNIGDGLYVSDLVVDKDVEILDDPEDMLVTISAVEEYKEEVVEVPEGDQEEGAEAKEEGAEESAAEDEEKSE